MSWIAKTLHVTPTGRAKPNGKSYRRQGCRVRQTKQYRPLPMDLQCHPQALTPTSRNPGCVDRRIAHFLRAEMLNYNLDDYVHGVGLYVQSEPGMYRVSSAISGETLGWLPPVDAMAYRLGAAKYGVELEVFSE